MAERAEGNLLMAVDQRFRRPTAISRLPSARSAMELVTSRLCSMDSAGCCKKRSSSRSISCSSAAEPSSGNSSSTMCSISPMQGSSTITVARRNRVFISAMDTEDMTVSKKVKWIMALAP